MNQTAKKKSPRAPSITLEDAIERALKVYDKERRNPAPIDVIAQNMGYKDSKNGAALAILASLKYYGLLEKIGVGMLAVSKDIEAYKFAPNDQLKTNQIIKWLKTPPVFLELLEKYQAGLPSDATLKFELIQMGFSPEAANSCLQAFIRSVGYAHYFDQPTQNDTPYLDSNSVVALENRSDNFAGDALPPPSNRTQPITASVLSEEIDRIPVRLSGGRRAWIEIPSPFYNSDKERLKAQIDLLITDDVEE